MEELRKKHSLPWIRFTTLACFFVIFDTLSCVSLWIAGGTSQRYLERSVEDFSLITSTFDLACLAAVRGVVLTALFFFLERVVLKDASTNAIRANRGKTTNRVLLQVLIILTTFACLCYAAIKGGLIIHGWSKARHMHPTYKALCIAATVFPLVELLIGVGSFYFMRKLYTLRVILIVNETEDLEDERVTEEEKKKSAFRAANLKRLLLMAQPEYGIMAAGIVFLVISSAATSLAPYLFGKVIDYAVPRTNCSSGVPENYTGDCVKRGMGKMNHTVLVLVGVFLIGSITTLFRSWLFTLAGERFVARLRNRLFAAVIKQDIGFFDTTRTGELTNRLSSDTQVIQNAVTVNISMLVRYLLQIILSLIMMFWQSARLTAVLLSVVPIIAIGAVQYGRMIKSLQKKYQDKLALASSTAEESISNVRTVRFFSNENRMVSSYEKDINQSYFLGRKLAAVMGVFSGVVSFFIQGAAALVLWYGGYLVYHSKLTPGALTSLMLYTLNLAMAFGFLSSLYGDFMKAVGASVRVFELLDRQSAVCDGSLQLSSLKGEVKFNNVTFSYPSRPDTVVLKDVSFIVHPGEVVALVGPSGGGKSTIVNLIEHFYNLQSGNIFLSGHNLTVLDPVWFRKHIGVVSQEPILFACSISDNIKFGKEDATDDEVIEAAKQANAHEFITSFEEGYDTMVGERGVRLSGGQKQRVAIARALLLNPSMLLLDEATSALDAESEHLVQEAIDRAMKGRTVLVIAHRLSTVRTASQVLVINKGKIVEKGSHDELLKSGGVYKRLVLRQLNAGSTNDQEKMSEWIDTS